MDLGIRGKTALVGGASRGLGFAISQRLAAEGANLVLVARDPDSLDQSRQRILDASDTNILTIAADLSDGSDIQRSVSLAQERFGSIDILVHNTGGPPPGEFMEHTDEAWNRAYEGLLLSVVRMCRAVLPGMQQRGWGRIVVDTSFTVKEPAPRLILSNVFRTGVVALAKTLSQEVAVDGVTVNCVCPGAFDTSRLHAIFSEQAQRSGQSEQAIEQEWVARIPIGRILQPHELGDLVAFLVSDLAGGITGASIPIEGGMLHGLF
ncbi:SDR family oxidoreductase [Candidatus Bipolaricaulota bacterium]|nr:SDR family oxidoreductase [Candidatus Bipolaricaulota bacterium]